MKAKNDLKEKSEIKKYRTLKRRYYDTEDDLEKMKLKQFEEVVKKSMQ